MRSQPLAAGSVLLTGSLQVIVLAFTLMNTSLHFARAPSISRSKKYVKRTMRLAMPIGPPKKGGSSSHVSFAAAAKSKGSACFEGPMPREVER